MTSARQIAATAAAVLVSASPFPASADSQAFSVDCAKGQTISSALEKGDSRKPLVLTVRGTCNENVSIDRDDVTLRSDGLSIATVYGPNPGLDAILVTGRRISVEGITITGGRNGIAAIGAADLNVRRSTVHTTGRHGISFTAGASGTIDATTVRLSPRDGVVMQSAQATIVNSTVTQNALRGVVVSNGGSVRLGVDDLNVPGGNTISLNGSNGVRVSNGSSALIAMNQITDNGNGTDPAVDGLGRHGVSVGEASALIVGGNTIRDNASNGVNARGANVVIGDTTSPNSSVNTITGNRGAGAVFGFLGSTMVVQNAVISGNSGFGFGLSLGSKGQLTTSTIQGNRSDGIRLIYGSGLLASGSSVVSGNEGWGLQCIDGESSVINTSLLGLSGNGLGDVSGTCTGF